MKKWICKVCGYTHQGEEAPDRCPQCGADKNQFYSTERKNGCALSMFIFLAVTAILILAIFTCSSSVKVNNSAVHSVELHRYLGNWYEIARLDHRFERGMTHCTATYTLQENGTISIINRGKKNGKWKTSQGYAKITNEPGVLRVSFFRPFYSDYRILNLAPDYSYSLVGGNDDDYLWILSRTPHLSQEICNQLISEAKHRGYDTEDLIWVAQ